MAFRASNVPQARWLWSVVREPDTTPVQLRKLAAEKGLTVGAAVEQLYEHGFALRRVDESGSGKPSRARVLPRLAAERFVERGRSSRVLPLRVESRVPVMSEQIAAKFPDLDRLIQLSPTACALVREAESLGIRFGGTSAEGPAAEFADRAYSDVSTKTVFLPEIDRVSKTFFHSDPEVLALVVMGERPLGGRDALLSLCSLIFEIENVRRYDDAAAKIRAPVDGQPVSPEEFARRTITYEMETQLCTARKWEEIRGELEPNWDKLQALGVSTVPLPLEEALLENRSALVDRLADVFGVSGEARSAIEQLAERAHRLVMVGTGPERYDRHFYTSSLKDFARGNIDLQSHVDALIAANPESVRHYAEARKKVLEADKEKNSEELLCT